MVRAGTVTELPGVGQTLEEKLAALLETGEIPALEKLRAKIPAGLIALTRLQGVGAKRVRAIWQQLGVDGPEALRAALDDGRVAALKGFGPTSAAKIARLLPSTDVRRRAARHRRAGSGCRRAPGRPTGCRQNPRRARAGR